MMVVNFGDACLDPANLLSNQTARRGTVNGGGVTRQELGRMLAEAWHDASAARQTNRE